MNDEEIQDINEEVADIAEAIIKLANLGEQLDNSKLHRNAIHLLLKSKTGLPVYAIKQVLDALPRLKDFIK